MKGKFINISVILCVVGLILVLLGYIQKCSEVNSAEQQLSQMEAAFGDSMKVVKVGNQELSQKVADLTEMGSESDELIKKLGFDLFSKNREIVRLSSIISSGVGYIDSTIVIDSSCIGLKLVYKDENRFRTLDVIVVVNNPPTFNTIEVFNPFGLTTYLSRDKEGIWVGHAIIDKEFQPYVKITDMKVEIEKDEFKDFYDNVSSFKMGPAMSLYSDLKKESIFNFGLRGLINETHDISLQKSLNSSGWLFDYSYLFNIID